MKRLFTMLAAAASLPIAVGAQVVSPAEFTTAEAPSSEYYAFGSTSSTGWRYLQVHDDLAGKAGTYSSFALRRDSTQNAIHYNSFSARIKMILSTAATTADTIDTTYNNNHGANKVTVCDKDVQFPVTPPGGAPSPFAYRLVFDQPYAFDGNGPLCWEVQVSNHVNALTTYYFDAANSRSTNPPLAKSYFGEGCRHSSRLNPAGATGTSSMNWGAGTGTLYLDGSNLPTNTLVFAALGASRTSFSGLALPFLFPGSLTAWSGPCNLLVSLDIVGSVPSTASATARFSVPVPARASMHGARVYGQFLAADSAAGNAFGLIASSAVEYCFVQPYGYPGVSELYDRNLFATTGTVVKNQGYVIELR